MRYLDISQSLPRPIKNWRKKMRFILINECLSIFLMIFVLPKFWFISIQKSIRNHLPKSILHNFDRLIADKPLSQHGINLLVICIVVFRLSCLWYIQNSSMDIVWLVEPCFISLSTCSHQLFYSIFYPLFYLLLNCSSSS